MRKFVLVVWSSLDLWRYPDANERTNERVSNKCIYLFFILLHFYQPHLAYRAWMPESHGTKGPLIRASCNSHPVCSVLAKAVEHPAKCSFFLFWFSRRLRRQQAQLVRPSVTLTSSCPSSGLHTKIIVELQQLQLILILELLLSFLLAADRQTAAV